ncbi:hypothetical protein F4803DRAFT_573728 [Xylaria telfairii]|nr:hypothetical protein F4803DRAFT_573728 [Xylaria telfairii]
MPATKKATVTSTKKTRRAANRRQPPTTTSKTTNTVGKAEAAETAITTTTTTKHISTAGVHKKEGKPRGAVARNRKKLKEALVKRVDARDAKEALAEQTELLGASTASPTPSPVEARPKKSKARPRREKKYMDDMLESEDGPENDRAKRWIPSFEHRTRPTEQPPGVPYGLWMSYKHLDDYVYRHSLSAAEVRALPLLDDVHEYQNSDGRTPKPRIPLGYHFDKNLELVPIGE